MDGPINTPKVPSVASVVAETSPMPRFPGSLTPSPPDFSVPGPSRQISRPTITPVAVPPTPKKSSPAVPSNSLSSAGNGGDKPKPGRFPYK